MGPRTSSSRSEKPAGRPLRPAGFAILVMGGLIATATPLLPAVAATGSATAESVESTAGPQWVTSDQRAAIRLIALLQSADLDGLDPNRFDLKSLPRALSAAANGNLKAVDRANAAFDRALVDYVTALRSAPSPDWSIVDRAAVPAPPSASALLTEAAAAPSLERWVDAMPFMHHSYSQLRRALVMARARGDESAEALLRINLARVRLLPASGRYVLVNTAAQRLYIYQDGQVVDSMRVVVGKPANPTPMMAATIKFTALNPYWNVPSDLAAERIAPNVVDDGLGYLAKHRYVVLSDWGQTPQPVDPSTIDWKAVADGTIQVRVRQLPGPNNSMGRMKFMFPNREGVYLHDTPDKQLLNEAARLFSGGCVRLEDAPRLGIWMFGKALNPKAAGPDEKVELPRPVPVYIAYLTAMPQNGQIAYYDDIYGRDQAALADQGESQQKLATF